MQVLCLSSMAMAMTLCGTKMTIFRWLNCWRLHVIWSNQLSMKLYLQTNPLETAPPIDDNSGERWRAWTKARNNSRSAHFKFSDMKDYLCFHGFNDWKSFNSLLNFSAVCSNVAKKHTIIDRYFLYNHISCTIINNCIIIDKSNHRSV